MLSFFDIKIILLQLTIPNLKMTEAIERIFISKDWITIVLMIIFTLLILNRIKFSERFYKLQYILLNNSYINSYSKASPLVFNVFNILFFAVATLTISFILFITLNLYYPDHISYDFIFFLKTLFFVVTFTVLRIILGFLLGSLFEREKEQRYFSFLKISYLANFSLMTIPLITINLYTESTLYTHFLLVYSLVLFLYYYVLILKNNQSFIFRNSFYIILYICTLEIAPFLIIFKALIV